MSRDKDARAGQESAAKKREPSKTAAADVHDEPVRSRIKDLWEHSDFLSTLFTSMVDYAIIAADFDGNILAYNEGARQIYGYDPREVIGKKKIEVFYSRDFIAAGRLDEQLTRLVNEGACAFDAEKIRKDGSRFPAHVLQALTKDKSESVIGFVELTEDLTERRASEETIRRSQRELDTRNQILNVFLTSDNEEMYQQVLEIILDTMESPFGVFGYLDESGALIVPTMTRMIWDKCQVPEKTIVYPRSEWGQSTWPTAIREKRTIYSNEPSTITPKGHIGITRHISLPIIHRNIPIGLIQVANRQTDYENEDIELLERVGRAIAPVLEARLQGERQESRRKAAERDLIDRNRLITDIIDNSGSLIYMVDADGRFMLANEQLAKALGAPRDKLIGLTREDVLPKAIAKQHRDNDLRVLNTKGSIAFEEENKEAKGRVIYDSRKFPIRDSEGCIYAIGGISIDVTARKEAEAKLADYRARLETLVEERTAALEKSYLNQNLVNALLKLTAEDRPLEKTLSDALDIVLSAHWLKLKPLGAILLADDEPGVLTMTASRGLPAGIEKSFARVPFDNCLFGRAGDPGKTEFVADLQSVHKKPHPDLAGKGYIGLPIKSTGRRIGLLALFFDKGIDRGDLNVDFFATVADTLAGIVERARARKALEAGRARLESIVSSVDDVIWSVDPSLSEVFFVSPACVNVVGCDPDEVQRSPALWHQSVHAEDKIRVTDALDALVQEGRPFDIEYRIVREIRTTWVRERAKLIRDLSGKPLSIDGVTMDITHIKHFEDELRAKREQLLDQNRVTTGFLNILETTATSLDFTEALNKLLPLIGGLTKGDACLAYFLDDNSRTLEPIDSWGLPQEGLAYFISRTPDFATFSNLTCVTDGLPEFVRSIDESRAVPASVADIANFAACQACVFLPVFYEQRLKALLVTLFKEKQIFPRRDQDLVAKLGKHLEASLTGSEHTIDLLNETMDLTKQLEMIEAMAGIDRAILRSSTKDQIIYSAIELFGRVVSNDVVEILEFNPAASDFTTAAAHTEGQTAFGAGPPLTKRRLKSWSHIAFGMPAYHPDLLKTGLGDDYESRLAGEGCRSLLVVPLLAKGELLGLIAIGSKKAAYYSPEHLALAQRLGNQIAVALSNTGLVKRLQDVLIGAVDSLVKALDAKSPWTQGHSDRVSDLSLKLGRSVRLDEQQLYDLQLAALFHDIGKIGTYDRILDKEERLSDKEYEAIKRHPGKTFDILAPIPGLKDIGKIAKHHHEKWNGRGYPDALTEDDIPYLSRIIAVADAYDAMTSDRPYRKALSPDEAAAEIEKNAGAQFDPDLATIFVDIIKNRDKSKETPPSRQKRRAA